jgi:hypothetical protein
MANILPFASFLFLFDNRSAMTMTMTMTTTTTMTMTTRLQLYIAHKGPFKIFQSEKHWETLEFF